MSHGAGRPSYSPNINLRSCPEHGRLTLLSTCYDDMKGIPTFAQYGLSRLCTYSQNIQLKVRAARETKLPTCKVPQPAVRWEHDVHVRICGGTDPNLNLLYLSVIRL